MGQKFSSKRCNRSKVKISIFGNSEISVTVVSRTIPSTHKAGKHVICNRNDPKRAQTLYKADMQTHEAVHIFAFA